MDVKNTGYARHGEKPENLLEMISPTIAWLLSDRGQTVEINIFV